MATPAMHRAIVGLAGTAPSAAERALFAAHPPAGIILFARNIETPAQLIHLTAGLRAMLPPGAVLMVDQEGGRVARLRPPHWRAHPPAAAIGALYEADPKAGLRAAWLTGALIGLDCAAAGFDVVNAPVLDRRVPGAHEVIGDRAFAAAPASVAALGQQVAAGLRAAGVQPVGKHIPGHGRALADSHAALPHLATEDSDDLVPFTLNNGIGWAMTAHIVYEAYDRLRPATLSPFVISEIIRGVCAFPGVLVSDDLAMHALSGAPGALAAEAISAGCDLVLHCTGVTADSASVLRAVPPVSGVTAARLRAARDAAIAEPLDGAALAAERAALLGEPPREADHRPGEDA